MIIPLSIAASAAAFVVLVAFVIRILNKGMGTLSETNRTLVEVRGAIHGLTEESKKLIHTANLITTDVKGKIRTVEPIFDSAHDVGEALHSVTKTVKQAAAAIGDVLHPPDQNESSPPKKKAIQIKLK